MTIIEQNIQTCGLVTELTKSQTDNFEIVQKHWTTFNKELEKWELNQSGGNWTKYGITYKIDEKYFYLTAIPTGNFAFPDHFTSKEIWYCTFNLWSSLMASLTAVPLKDKSS